jgi:hypothetical protein
MPVALRKSYFMLLIRTRGTIEETTSPKNGSQLGAIGVYSRVLDQPIEDDMTIPDLHSLPKPGRDPLSTRHPEENLPSIAGRVSVYCGDATRASSHKVIE